MRSLFFDSLHFIADVLLYWWATPVAALVAGGVAVFEKVKAKSISKRVFVVFGITYLFVACFFVWRDEHNVLSAEQKAHEKTTRELDDAKKRNAPDLRGEIRGSSLGTQSGTSKEIPSGTPMLTLFVRISNLGAQSVVRDYALSIDLPDRGRVVIPPIHLSGDELRLFRDNSSTINYKMEDAIYLKTAREPIKTGDMKEGFIVFPVPGVSKDQVARAISTVVLSYSDVTTKVYPVKYEPSEHQITFLPSAPLTLSEPNKKKKAK